MAERGAMLTAENMQAFAREWVANWNARDVDAVVGHMHEDATFASPIALSITGERTVQGAEALRTYWKQASAETKALHFELIEAICDVPAQTLVVFYRAAKEEGSRTAVEIMRFREGRQVSGEALYGAAL